jgi:NHL repeat
MVPLGGSAFGAGGTGNTLVRIFVPTGTASSPIARPVITPSPPPSAFVPLAGPAPVTPPAAPVPGATPGPPGSQTLAINVTGPTTINQNVTVGPNASGCSPAPGGTACQLSLTLPAGTYTGTVGSGGAAIGFTVAPSTNNVLNLTLGGTPSSVAIVPGSFLSFANAQGGVDFYGAGRHPVLVELLDANQNVIVNAPVNFSLSQAGGALSLGVSQTSAAATNLFYVTVPAVASAAAGFLRASASYQSIPNLCLQSGATCNGTVRVDVRQLLAVANSGASSVALYANGQNAPLATIQSGIAGPQAVVFDGAGDLFVANQLGSVSEYAPPYSQPPTTIGNGINHPQALAVDSRGNLFVANGNGSNTVTVYSAPFGGGPATVIAAGVSDPVSLALDAAADLFVVNAASNTVTEYAPPYSGTPVAISKGLNAPNSLALDGRGNLFVANLNSTPNSVVEYTPPFTEQSAPVATITNGINEQGTIGLNGVSSLFVPNQGANTVTEYVPPYSSAPTTIVGGQSQPVALAIDTSGNLYVANYGNNTVTVYAPPYGGGSWTTLSNAISAPVALALSPATPGGVTVLP